MVTVSEYTDSFADRWTAYVRASEYTAIAHEIGWREVMARGLGHTPRYFVAHDRDKVTGILPLFLVTTWWRAKYLVSLPWIDYGGIIADDESTEKLLLEQARKTAEIQGAQFVEFRSICRQNLGLPLREDKVTFLLPLESDPDVLWKGFDAKLRNQIRKSQKSGLTTEFGGIDRLDEFYGVFAHNMRDLGTPVWGKRFFSEILGVLSDTARLILVRKDGVAIAGGLVLAFKDRLYVPSASSYRHALEFCPNHALYWAVIVDGCTNGFRFLDFGRSSKGGNTFNFKKQWGAPPTQLTWQYLLHRTSEIPAINPGNPKYELFIKMWRKLPLPVANFIGPRLIRNFP
jgi:FemAB-related protein (PEP-CTERM system-associated)